MDNKCLLESQNIFFSFRLKKNKINIRSFHRYSVRLQTLRQV